MQQRLYLPETATADVNGHVALQFDPPPQGTVWTGSVALYATPTPSTSPQPVLSNGPLQGATWWLTRNQSPILQMTGAATAADVQCISQEILGVEGWGLAPYSTVMAVWSGWSDDASAAALCEPHPYGVTAPYMQVYNTRQTNSTLQPLSVTLVPPAPTDRVVGVAYGFSSTPGQTTVMIPASSVRHFQLLSATLQLATAQQGTTAQNAACLATLVLDDGVTQTPILGTETLVIQTSSQTTTVTLDLRGLAVPFDANVSLVTGSLSGGALRANASVVYSYIPTAP